MTPLQIINEIKKLNKDFSPDAFLVLSKEVEGLSYSFESNKVFTRVDIREKTKAFCRLNQISVRQLALVVGEDYKNFHTFLRGGRSLPYDKVEILLALISLRE
jgi:hypothetical protein